MWILGGIVVLQVTGSTEREDAHPQPPFTIIYSRLLKYGNGGGGVMNGVKPSTGAKKHKNSKCYFLCLPTDVTYSFFFL